MTTHSRSSDLPVGAGLTSVILGSVGALLFFLPVLGVPLGAVGLIFGIVGLVAALLGGCGIRWPVEGIVISVLALGIGLVIGLSPKGFLPSPKEPYAQQSAGEHPYVPPPARPEE